MVKKFFLISALSAAFGFSTGAFAAPATGDSANAVSALVKTELSKKFPGARIDLTGDIHWTRGTPSGQVTSVSVISQTARGDVQFLARNAIGAFEGWVGYMALVPAYIALRRIHPGERLERELFVVQDVNVASGQGFEYRGVILSSENPLSGLESRQSILEGQFVLSSAVQRVPDIRRGDSVRIQLISGGLTLSTLGIAQEPAYLHGKVRVLTQKTKREMTGELLPGGSVEVRL